MLSDAQKSVLVELLDKTQPKGLYNKLKNNHPDIFNIIEQFKDAHSFVFSQAIYHLLNNTTEVEKCNKEGCIQQKSYSVRYQKYNDYCKKHVSSEITKQKLIEKYGVDNPNKTPQAKQNTIQTNVNKHGVEHHTKLKSIQDKKQLTIFEHYGKDGLWNDELRQKRKQTCLEKYGVDHHTKSNVIQDKKRNTCLSKYGVDTVMKIQSIKDHFSKLFLTKNPTHVQYIKDFINSCGFELLTEYTNAHANIELKCKTCGNIKITTWNYIQQGNSNCITCNPIFTGYSKQEKEIVQYIKSLDLNLEISENTKNIISPFELDIYIPSKKIAIEYCGLWWHSSGGKNSVCKPENYHLDKLNKCNDLGIKLITIFEDEWILYQDQVKTKICIELGLTNHFTRIYARHCEIKLLDYPIKKDFFDTYHLQGDTVSSICYGLYYQNELISAMSFVKNDNQWILQRYACIPYTIICGGASKLFKYFTNNNEWSTIETFADRRYSVGNLYITLGFTLTHNTQPNYWYWGNDIIGRKHRLNFSKSKLKEMKSYNEDYTEKHIMLLEGYRWIYDCGNSKFILTNQKENNSENSQR